MNYSGKFNNIVLNKNAYPIISHSDSVRKFITG